MKYYLDISLLPDAEASLGFLWYKIYQQVHLAMVDMKTADGKSEIAIAIPLYKKNKHPLGGTLRLFAPTQKHFEVLDVSKWLSRFVDYVHCKSVREVPSAHSYIVMSRKQSKSYNQFKRQQAYLIDQRLIHTNETEAQARQHVEAKERPLRKLPFIHVNSLSSQSRYRLFIEKKEVKKEKKGEFNCYGLSLDGATVPSF
jgi:CRISPR-associated endonuclease Csy4